MADADQRSRADDPAMVRGIAGGDVLFLTIADVDGRGDALIEHQFAPEPRIIGLRIPETGKNEFAIRVDDPGACGYLDLACGSGRDDTVALDHDDGVRDGRA